MNRFRWIATFAAFLVLSSGLLHATTYNVATDFSIASNPNGVWTYGFEPTVGGAFTAFPTGNGYHCCSSTILAWGDSGGSVAAEFYNPGPASANLFGQASAPVGVGVAGLYPGLGTESYAVFRFTAPTTDVFTLNATFTGLDTGGVSTDVHILLNNAAIFNGSVIGTGAPSNQGFGTGVAMLAGQTLDFLVGPGGNGISNDTTGLSATLVGSVPEPTTWGITALGVFGVFVARRRLSNQAS